LLCSRESTTGAYPELDESSHITIQELHYDWRFTANQFVLVTSPLRLMPSNFIFQLNACGYSPYATSSLMRGWVCRLQLRLARTNADILKSESRATQCHLLLSQIRDSPNLEGQVPVFISSSNRVTRLYSQTLGSLFVSYDSQGYGGGIRSSLHTGIPPPSYLCKIRFNIVTWRPNAGIVTSEDTSVARQRLSKHIPATTNMQAAIEYLPLLCNGAVNTPSQQSRDCFQRGPCKVIIRKSSEAGSSSVV
jgi:hypothetical protein